jgi:hypothetical protein
MYTQTEAPTKISPLAPPQEAPGWDPDRLCPDQGKDAAWRSLPRRP